MRVSKFRTLALIAAVAFAAAPAAAAREASAWVKCDGLARSEGAASTVGRIFALSLSMGLVGLPENSRIEPAAKGKAGVDACTEALAGPELERFWARKVSLLRWRAIHAIEAGDTDSALTDLRATSAVAAANGAEAEYARSLGLSIKLLEAALLAKKGDQAGANRLAVEVADARPYSTNLVGFAAAILAADPGHDAAEDRVLTRFVALEPGARSLRAESREWGASPEAAADDWLFLLESGASSLPRPDTGMMPEYMRRLVERTEAGLPKTRDPYYLVRAAVATARANRLETAKKLIGEIDTRLAASASLATTGDAAQLTPEQRAQRIDALLLRNAARYVTLAKGWVLLHEGKPTEARALLTAQTSIPVIPATFELIQRLKTAEPGVNLSGFDPAALEGERASQRIQRAARLDLEKYAKALPTLDQTPANAYKRGTAAGYSDRAREDKAPGRTVLFTWNGSATPASVEEMAILRAAHVALEAGAKGFVIIDREDYKRFLVTTTYGVQTGDPTPAGFQTRLDIEYADPAAPPPAFAAQGERIFDATKVWTDLSGHYVRVPERGARK